MLSPGVSIYITEILPPSMGSMPPKAGLMGWRVYSILPVSGFFLRTSFLSVTPRFLLWLAGVCLILVEA